MSAAKLRVAIDMTFPNRGAAGSSTYARELIGALREREEIDVVPIDAGSAPGLPGTARWLLGGAARRMAGAQLVHCPAFVAPWRLPAPFVLTVHDTSIFSFPDDHDFEWRAYIRAFLGRRARAAARVITGTESAKTEIARDLRVPADRIAVTPYGIGKDFSRAAPVSRTQEGPPTLLFAGAPTRRKNLELVLQAMSAAPETSMLGRGRLVITGADQAQHPDQAERIRRLGLTGRVEWRGKVPREQMPSLLASADVLVYPSWHEGFGFPALEAMAAGTPVVASTAPCLPEVLGDAAVLVDPSDARAFIEAVEAVISRPDLRAQLVARGRARAGLYTWSRCAELTTRAYFEAAAGRP
ncbi:MAG TPA: glycosyltransferase family 1 protein [Candidatus Dormibacteraeota bacterium]|nr:glycosyltransferase family 1 protein [Candidatus Dormibacteraeota bacterium]